MSVKVRKARAEDADQLIASNVLFNGRSDTASNVEYVRRSIQEEDSTETVYVAEVDGRLIGFATLQLTSSFCYQRLTAELTGIFVREADRRRGVASMLMQAVIEDCEGLEVLELFLRVNHENQAAIDFYQESGLVEADHFEYRIRYYE